MDRAASKRRLGTSVFVTMCMGVAACSSSGSEAQEATAEEASREGSAQERALMSELVGVGLEQARNRLEDEGLSIGLIDRVGVVATADAEVTGVILASDGSIDLVVGPVALATDEAATTCRSLKPSTPDEAFVLAWTSAGIVGLAVDGTGIESLADDADDWLVGGDGPMDVTLSDENVVSIKHPGRTWTIQPEADTDPVSHIGLIGDERPILVRVGSGEDGYATSVVGFEPDGSVAWKFHLDSEQILIPNRLVSTPDGFMLSLNTEAGIESNWMGFDRDGEVLWTVGADTSHKGAAPTISGPVVLGASGQLLDQSTGAALATGPYIEIVTSSWSHVLLRSSDGTLSSFDAQALTVSVLSGLEGCNIAAPRSIKVGT